MTLLRHEHEAERTHQRASLHDLRATPKSLMSVAADFAVTQVVDGCQGVHARIRHAVFPSA